jgi:two-component system, LuxR family, response regulator FixJ
MTGMGESRWPDHESRKETPANGVVYVVDDDTELREYMRWLLEPAGWRVETYGDPNEFLAAYRDAGAACVVTDVCMPGLSGLDLQRELAERGIDLPVILISAYANVPNVVRAMREGALDFLEKPFDGETLLGRVREALARSDKARRSAAERAEVAARLARLTPRQRAVLEGLTQGKPSKIIAADLGVSPRTVDVHRFRLMQNLGANSLPDLFRIVVLVGSGEGADGAVRRPPEGKAEA